MYYGAAYYPEHWPEDRWEIDAKLMQAAGMNAVRMGEFAWSAFEPEEGRYDFAWMDRAAELLGKHNSKTLMCTASRTPPPRTFAKYPGIMNVLEDLSPYKLVFAPRLSKKNHVVRLAPEGMHY